MTSPASSSASRILLLESIHTGAKLSLERAGFEVELLSKALHEDDLIEALQGCVAVGVRSKTHITPRVLQSVKSLRAVGAFCIGTNQIALTEAHDMGVPAFNAPFSNTRSVAELIIAQIVFLARNMGDRNNEMHRGEWKKTSTNCHEVRGKTLGIIGYGHIGRQVGVLAEAFGLQVIFYDIASQLPMGNNKPAESLEDLLGRSDFVSLHVPATPDTEWMIGETELGQIKKGGILLNLSRGNVVVIDALAAALKRGDLGGASVDVYPKEPRTNDEPFETPLQGLKNVILSPHIGGSTEEAQVAIGQEVSGALIRFLAHGSTEGAVNFPNADLPARAGVVRVQHIHRNVPGVLGDVLSIVARHGSNVLGQVLSTDDELGYLLMDVEKGKSADIAADIAALETTIRSRILD